MSRYVEDVFASPPRLFCGISGYINPIAAFLILFSISTKGCAVRWSRTVLAGDEPVVSRGEFDRCVKSLVCVTSSPVLLYLGLY